MAGLNQICLNFGQKLDRDSSICSKLWPMLAFKIRPASQIWLPKFPKSGYFRSESGQIRSSIGRRRHHFPKRTPLRAERVRVRTWRLPPSPWVHKETRRP